MLNDLLRTKRKPVADTGTTKKYCRSTKQNKFNFYFGFVLTYSYLWDYVSRVGCISEKQKKKVFSFGFSLDLHYLCRRFR